MTSYPLSSLFENQLLSMMDYHLSAVFHPLIYTEPRMVRREAWRYELDDAQSPITLAGTVYSEMQGAGTIEEAAVSNNMFTAFEGGATAHVSGGTVEEIPTLTKEALTDFHDKYYQPSNALIILYGDLDMTAIDSVFSGRTEAMRLQWMKEIKQTTVEDVRASADDVERLVTEGVRSTSATASEIEKNKDLFTSVVRLNDGARG